MSTSVLGLLLAIAVFEKGDARSDQWEAGGHRVVGHARGVFFGRHEEQQIEGGECSEELRVVVDPATEDDLVGDPPCLSAFAQCGLVGAAAEEVVLDRSPHGLGFRDRVDRIGDSLARDQSSRVDGAQRATGERGEPRLEAFRAHDLIVA